MIELKTSSLVAGDHIIDFAEQVLFGAFIISIRVLYELARICTTTFPYNDAVMRFVWKGGITFIKYVFETQASRPDVCVLPILSTKWALSSSRIKNKHIAK